MNIETEREIISKYSQEAPVNISAMINELGIDLKAENLGKEISGLIQRIRDNKSEDRYVITVNSEHSKSRQRFTMAHELAHYFLHRIYIGDGILEDALYRSKLSNVKEREANIMAARILTPRDLVIKLMSKYKNDYSHVAKALEVSQEMLRITLRDYKLI
jgi:Zn-dependent peptidase ImmA (M78 family)